MEPSRQLAYLVWLALGAIMGLGIPACSTRVTSEPGASISPQLSEIQPQAPSARLASPSVREPPPPAVPSGSVSSPPEEKLAAPPEPFNLQSDPASRRLLAWTFKSGNVFRFQTDVLEILSTGAQPIENQRSYWFRWEVIDVTPDDEITIAVLIERVSLALKEPQFVYDSADPHSQYRPLVDPSATRELAKALALLDAQVLIEINRRGEATRYVGPELGATNCRFMPTDFPILPAVPVGPLDAWQQPARQSDEITQCTFLREQMSGDRTIALVDCASVPALDSPSDRLAPMTFAHTTARFDQNAGRYLSRITTTPSQQVRQYLLSARSTAAFTRFQLKEPSER